MNSFVLKLLHSSESGGQLWSVFDPLTDVDSLQELGSLATEVGLLEQELTHPERNASVQFDSLKGIVKKSKYEIEWAINQLIAKTELGDFSPLCEDYFSSRSNPIEFLDIPLLVKIKADAEDIPTTPKTSWLFHLRIYGYLLNENILIILGHCIRTTGSLQGCTRTAKIHQRMKLMNQAIENTERLESLIETEKIITINL